MNPGKAFLFTVVTFTWCLSCLATRSLSLIILIAPTTVRGVLKQQNITVNFTGSLYDCHRKFLSITIDTSEVKKDWKGFDFGSSKLQNMAAALSPADIRLGGTNADLLTFDPDAKTYLTDGDTEILDNNYKFDAEFFDSQWKKDFKNFTMTGKQWDTMTAFLRKVGWDLMFDFNIFKWKDGLWNPSNADLLLNYSAARGVQIPFFQLGNEPNSFRHNFNLTISPATLVKDFKILRTLISKFELYRNGYLYGPDVTNLDRHPNSREYLQEFIAAGGYSVVDEISLHHYYIDGRTAKVDDFLNVSILDSLKDELRLALNYSRCSPQPLPVRLTETSSCFGGGAPGLSDRYAAGFLWLDKLGLAAQYGVTRVFRQTFFGGNYALVNETLDPNPDFFLSVLYKRLVEGPVFNVSLDPDASRLRVYAHCARTESYPAGALVIYYLNLRRREAVLSFSQFEDYNLDLYLLTPGDDHGLKSRYVKLNGVLLSMSGPQLPPMLPESFMGHVTVQAQSFGFMNPSLERLFKDEKENSFHEMGTASLAEKPRAGRPSTSVSPAYKTKHRSRSTF